MDLSVVIVNWNTRELLRACLRTLYAALPPSLACEVIVVDKAQAGGSVKARPKAEAGNAKHVAAPMPGAVVAVVVAPGEEVAAGQKLLTLEAMKMETTLHAPAAGKVAEVLVRPGTPVEGGDLVIRFE